jgi:hypothetical protein
MDKTVVYGNWRYYRDGKYIYGWSTQRQHHLNDKFVSFVRRWHKTKERYVTVDSKTATHATRAAAKRRAAKLAGHIVSEPKPKTKSTMPLDHAYCMSCKESKQIRDPEKTKQITKSGKVRYAITGHCDCGTKMFKYISETKECPQCFEQKRVSEFPDGYPYTCKSCR